MENKNITMNLIIKQMVETDAMAYNRDYLASSTDSEFGIFNKAYQDKGKLYAKLSLAVQNNNCISDNCVYEIKQLRQLDNAPAASIDFMEVLNSELMVTEEDSYDVNNYYGYLVAYCITTNKPGFSKNDGYDVNLYLNEDGSQTIVFSGPSLKEDLVINSFTLKALIDSDTSLVVSTPDINKDMLRLLTEVGLFDPEFVDVEKEQLKSNAKILDEFILKTETGEPDYRIIDIGNGKGKNVLQFDMEKIQAKIDPFINAEVTGLLSSEQDAVAAWNVYIGRGSSVDEDAQMVQDANAGSLSWSYEEDLPLSQDKKVEFESKYKEYFINNYLKEFMTNKFPTVKEDAAVFDLEEAKQNKAQKFLDDNNLN